MLKYRVHCTYCYLFLIVLLQGTNPIKCFILDYKLRDYSGTKRKVIHKFCNLFHSNNSYVNKCVDFSLSLKQIQRRLNFFAGSPRIVDSHLYKIQYIQRQDCPIDYIY